MSNNTPTRGRPKGPAKEKIIKPKKVKEPKKTKPGYEKIANMSIEKLTLLLPKEEARLAKIKAYYEKNPNMGIGWQYAIESIARDINEIKNRLGVS